MNRDVVFRLCDKHKVRVTDTGVTWFHFRCPWCKDKGQHLGIGTKDGKFFMNCWVCGRKSPPDYQTVTIIADGQPIPWGKRNTVSTKPSNSSFLSPSSQSSVFVGIDELPGVGVVNWSVESHSARMCREMCARLWPGLSWDDLVSAGLRAGDGLLDTVWLPFWTEEGWGYQARRENGKPKVVTKGPKGLGFLRTTKVDTPRDWVVVEGWSDAAAIPYPFSPAILFGVGNWREALPLRGSVTFCLDNDAAGKQASRKVLLQRLKDNQPGFVCRMDTKDPADAGKKKMLGWLSRRERMDTVEKILKWCEE